QFGGSVGGPIRKDKLFVFASYSGLRQQLQDVLTGAVVPSLSERVGDFSTSSRKAAGSGIVNGVIAGSAVDPVAMTILKNYIPLANLSGNNWQGPFTRPSDLDDVNSKLDYSLSSNHQIMASYFRSAGFEYQKTAGNIPWSQQDYNWTQQNVNFAD